MLKKEEWRNDRESERDGRGGMEGKGQKAEDGERERGGGIERIEIGCEKDRES